MNLKLIEARIAKLERAPGNSRLARMSEAEIEAEALACLEILMGPEGSFAAVVAEMEAADEPDIREGARLVVQYHGPRFGYSEAPAAMQ